MRRAWSVLMSGILLGSLACGNERRGDGTVAEGAVPTRPRVDEAPTMLNQELPFRYPAALYARRVQGNVTLRLFVDRTGRLHPESTRVEQSSGYPALDSAAVAGSQELRFEPGKLQGEPIDLALLFPVYFRHPDAAPLPGDTVLGEPRR
jgi:TonB family protein